MEAGITDHVWKLTELLALYSDGFQNKKAYAKAYLRTVIPQALIRHDGQSKALDYNRSLVSARGIYPTLGIPNTVTR